MVESERDRKRREWMFRRAEEYHLAHALRLIGRGPYDEIVGRVDRRVRKGGMVVYAFMGDPILEVTYEEGITPANPTDNFPIETYDKTLRFNHLKGDPPSPFKPSGSFPIEDQRGEDDV